MKVNLTKAHAKEIQETGQYKKIPLSMEVALGDRTPAKVFEILKSMSQSVFLLESAQDKKQGGRYSFLGYDPKLEITCVNHRVQINAGMSITFEDVTPQQYIRKIMKENKSAKLFGNPPFTGGLVGYFAFDFIKYSEVCLTFDGKDDENLQDLDLMLFDKVIVFDHLLHKIIFIVNIDTQCIEESYNKGLMELENGIKLLEQPIKNPEIGIIKGEFTPLFEEEAYCEMVEKAKRRIYEGDIFQVVLSNRWSAPFQGSLFPTYLKLKETNPSPYMFYFSGKSIELAGASPETLVKLEEGGVTTFPLAGTRPRGKTKKEDDNLEKELLLDEKECAEHNMLVDLGRNDLGRICKFNTVKVDHYKVVERFSHVMHIGSTVSGRLQDEKDALDTIEAVLPAGTLSGAPKIKACEIINELEKNKRGIYGGAIGYLDFSGNADVCIAIRLAYKKGNRVFVRSGAGIVADSIPSKEYEECKNKAKAVMNALEEMR